MNRFSFQKNYSRGKIENRQQEAGYLSFSNRTCSWMELCAHACDVYIQSVLNTSVPGTAPRAFHRDSFNLRNLFKVVIVISPIL